jgi:hypothetical protein
MQNLIKDDSQRPNIDCIGVIMKPRLLWSDVLLCSGNRFHNYFFGAEAEVCNFDYWHSLSNDVFSF